MTSAPEQEPWVELQRLTLPEREAFMEHLAQADPALASALVARVLRELAGPCSTLVFDADDCRYTYDDGWSEDYPDSWTLAAHPCVATDFVVGYSELLVDADRAVIADELVGLLGGDPGSYELLWGTVAKVPVAAAPQAWILVVIHGEYDTAADEEVRKRVWQHIAHAPTEARREACRHAAGQRDDAEVAMRGAACLAELGDSSALPVRTPDLSLEEFAFALHMLAFDETPTAAARIATFAHPMGVRMVVEGPDEEDPSPPPESETIASQAWARADLPFNRWHLPSHLVSGLDCDPGPPATCRISRGRRYPGGVALGQATTIQLTEHPEGGWAVVEAHKYFGDPLCEDE